MVCRAHIPAINRPQRLDQIPREHTMKKPFGDDTPKHFGFRGTGMFHYMPGTKKSRLHSKMKADSEETSEPEAEITGFSATGLPAGTVVTDELREKTSSTIRSEMTERSGLRTRDCDSGDGETQQGLREKARGVAARWFSGGPSAFREGPLSEPVAPEDQDRQVTLTAEERAEQFLESATLVPAIDGDTLVVGPGVDGLVLTIPAGRDALQEEYERSRLEAARQAMTHSEHRPKQGVFGNPDNRAGDTDVEGSPTSPAPGGTATALDEGISVAAAAPSPPPSPTSLMADMTETHESQCWQCGLPYARAQAVYRQNCGAKRSSRRDS